MVQDINGHLSIQTLFAHIKPHALHKVLGPAGPRRIAGVLFSLTPQCWHFRKLKNISERINIKRGITAIIKISKQYIVEKEFKILSYNKLKPWTHTVSERVPPSWRQLCADSQLEAPELSFKDANWPFFRCILEQQLKIN